MHAVGCSTGLCWEWVSAVCSWALFAASACLCGSFHCFLILVIKCSATSGCGGVTDVLEYIIITGIIFTGKDESESFSPDYILFCILPLLLLSSFSQIEHTFMSLLKLHLTILVFHFHLVFQPSQKTPNPPLTVLSDDKYEHDVPFARLLAGNGKNENSPGLCNSLRKLWCSTADGGARAITSRCW